MDSDKVHPHRHVDIAVSDLGIWDYCFASFDSRSPRTNFYLTSSVMYAGLTKNHALTVGCPLGNQHFSSTCLKLFWTSPKFHQRSKEQRKCSTALTCLQASDRWNLLARQENLLAPDYWTKICRAPKVGSEINFSSKSPAGEQQTTLRLVVESSNVKVWALV